MKYEHYRKMIPNSLEQRGKIWVDKNYIHIQLQGLKTCTPIPSNSCHYLNTMFRPTKYEHYRKMILNSLEQREKYALLHHNKSLQVSQHVFCDNQCKCIIDELLGWNRYIIKPYGSSNLYRLFFYKFPRRIYTAWRPSQIHSQSVHLLQHGISGLLLSNCIGFC
jgi:hypothetical protein